MTHTGLHKTNMRSYRYHLPEDRIAKHPVQKRDASKLLIYKNGSIRTSTFGRLTDYLPEGSPLVFNNTKVIQARILFRKPTGARIEIFCMNPLKPSDYPSSFESRGHCSWECLIGNNRKWKEGSLSRELRIQGKTVLLKAERIRQKGQLSEVIFRWNDMAIRFAGILDVAGRTPIPPYLKRESGREDRLRYQTVYSRIEGSVAAPTAGLHFTPRVLDSLARSGKEKIELTLHIGAGTFRPIKDPSILNHRMHTEYFRIEREQIEKIRDHAGDLTAVGTTSVRTLESLFWLGAGVLNNKDQDGPGMHLEQWTPYKYPMECEPWKSLDALLSVMNKQKLSYLDGSTAFMIVPGYRFRMVRNLITNFHLPRSSLLLLVAAFIGEDWRKVYRYALENNFRFLSYGDSSLLLREEA